MEKARGRTKIFLLFSVFFLLFLIFTLKSAFAVSTYSLPFFDSLNSLTYNFSVENSDYNYSTFSYSYRAYSTGFGFLYMEGDRQKIGSNTGGNHNFYSDEVNFTLTSDDKDSFNIKLTGNTMGTSLASWSFSLILENQDIGQTKIKLYDIKSPPDSDYNCTVQGFSSVEKEFTLSNSFLVSDCNFNTSRMSTTDKIRMRFLFSTQDHSPDMTVYSYISSISASGNSLPSVSYFVNSSLDCSEEKYKVNTTVFYNDTDSSTVLYDYNCNYPLESNEEIQTEIDYFEDEQYSLFKQGWLNNSCNYTTSYIDSVIGRALSFNLTDCISNIRKNVYKEPLTSDFDLYFLTGVYQNDRMQISLENSNFSTSFLMQINSTSDYVTNVETYDFSTLSFVNRTTFQQPSTQLFFRLHFDFLTRLVSVYVSSDFRETFTLLGQYAFLGNDIRYVSVNPVATYTYYPQFISSLYIKKKAYTPSFQYSTANGTMKNFTFFCYYSNISENRIKFWVSDLDNYLTRSNSYDFRFYSTSTESLCLFTTGEGGGMFSGTEEEQNNPAKVFFLIRFIKFLLGDSVRTYLSTTDMSFISSSYSLLDVFVSVLYFFILLEFLVLLTISSVAEHKLSITAPLFICSLEGLVVSLLVSILEGIVIFSILFVFSLASPFASHILQGGTE